jgi:hypothetical protein
MNPQIYAKFGAKPLRTYDMIRCWIDEKSLPQHRIIFLLAQSYMPAQEIQLLKNNDNPKLSPWYSEKQAEILSTPEWNFTGNQLMRFK